MKLWVGPTNHWHFHEIHVQIVRVDSLPSLNTMCQRGGVRCMSAHVPFLRRTASTPLCWFGTCRTFMPVLVSACVKDCDVGRAARPRDLLSLVIPSRKALRTEQGLSFPFLRGQVTRFPLTGLGHAADPWFQRRALVSTCGPQEVQFFSSTMIRAKDQEEEQSEGVRLNWADHLTSHSGPLVLQRLWWIPGTSWNKDKTVPTSDHQIHRNAIHLDTLANPVAPARVDLNFWWTVG